MPLSTELDLTPAFEQGFDAWLPQQSQSLQDSMNRHLQFTPEELRESEKKRLLSVGLVAQRTSRPIGEVDQQFESFYMPAFSKDVNGLGASVVPKDANEFYEKTKQKLGRDKQKKETIQEGIKAALRGDDVIPSLQAWQAKNLDRMPDSTEFTRGFLQARESISGIGVSDAVDAYQRAMQGSPKDGDEETLKDFEGLLLDLPEAKRKAVLTAATMMAQARGEKAVKGIGAREFGPMGGAGAAINAITGFFQEIGESSGRFAGKLGGIAKDEQLESMSNMPTLPLITDAAKSLHPLAFGVAYTSIAKIDSAEKASNFLKEWKVTSFGTASADVTRADIDEANQTAKQYRELDADEKKLVEAAQKRELKKNQIARELRSIAESSDPVGEISGAIGSSVAMAAANFLTRGKTLPISWQLYSEANYDQLRLENPSLEPSEARAISRMAGAGEAALDALEIGILLKLPSVAAVLKSGTSAAWQNAGARLGATYAFEQIQEGAQDLTLPFTRAVFEAVGRDTGLDMTAEWKRWKDSRGTVAIASIPLILLGAGIATHRDIKDAQNLLSSRDRLGEQGIIEVDAVPIIEAARAGKMDEAQTLYIDAFKRRSSEVAAEYQDKLDTQQKAVAEAVVEVTRQGLIPEYTILPGGKVVVTDLNDGSKATFDSWREAQPVIEQNMNEMERINNDSILRIANAILKKKGEEVTVSPLPSDSLVDRVRDGSMSPENAIKAAIAANVIQGVNIDEARKIAADVFGESQEERIKIMRDAVERAIMLGSNVVKGGVSKSKLFKGANLTTLIEETGEGRLKEGLRLGRYKKSDWLRLIQQAEEATGEKFLVGSTADKVNASPDFAPRELVEAVSRIFVADVLGRLQDGRRIGSGSITTSLEENNSPLVAWVRAFKRLLASVLQTAKRIREARKTGKLGDEYDAYIDDLLGVDQQAKFERETAPESEAIANEAINLNSIDSSLIYSEEAPGPNGETFSLGYLGNVQDSGNVQLKAVDLARGTHESEGLDQGSEGMGTFRYRKDNETLYWHLPPGELRKESAMAALERKGFKVKRNIVMVFGSEDSYLAHGLAREVATTFSISRAVPADASKIVQMPDGAQLVGPTTFSIRAYHGTPHKVDKFSLSKIGTGEGSQAYGWGLYMAESKEVAGQYRKNLSGKAMIRSRVNGWEVVNELDGKHIGLFQDRAEADAAVEKYNTSLGNLYTVELIPNEDEFLDWDKPLSEQSEKVKAALDNYLPSSTSALKGRSDLGKFVGQQIYTWISNSGNVSERSKALAQAGIPGIKYLDAGSRSAGNGSRNFVIFDDNLVRILEENGNPVSGETFSLRKFFPTANIAAQAADVAHGRKWGNVNTSAPLKSFFQRGMQQGGGPVAKGQGAGVFFQRSTPKPFDFASIYQSAMVGQSSSMLSLDRLFDEAKKQNPQLTEAEFGARIQAIYHNGELFLEPGESPEAMRTALAKYGVRDSLGIPAMFARPMEASQETFSLVTPAQDAEYIAAVESGDVAKQQAMVDAAAKAADDRKIANRERMLLEAEKASKPKIPKPRHDRHDGEYDFTEKYTQGEWEVSKFIDKSDSAYDGKDGEFDKAAFDKALEAMPWELWNRSGDFSEMEASFDDLNEALKEMERKVEWAEGQQASLSASDAMRSEFWDNIILPHGWELNEVQDTGGRSVYFDISDGNGRKWRLSIRDHAPSPFREQEFGSVDKYWLVPRSPSPDDLDTALNEMESWMASKAKGESAAPITRDEGGNVIPLSQRFNPADNRITFSIRSGDFASRMYAAFSPFQRNPELRLAIAQVVKARAQKLGAEWIEKAAVLRSASNIEAERKSRYTLALNDLLGAKGMTLDDVERSKDQKDFDMWQRFQESKDLLMKSGMTEAEAVPLAAASSKKWRSNIVKNVKESMAQAKAEADQWAEGAKKEAGSPKAQREMLKGALRLLDGILAAAPPEVRARVGGYVKLAGLATDEAMLDEIDRRIDKLNVELEKWLKKEYLQRIAKLFKRFAPKKDDKGRITSKITAEAAEDIGFAFDFASLDDANQEKEMAAIEKTLEESEDSSEIQDAIGKLAIVQLFHKLEGRESSELEAAAVWLNELGSGAREARKIIDAARAEWVNEAKNVAKVDATNGKLSSLPDAENVEADVRSSTFKRFTNDVKGFLNSALFTMGQQLEIVFGQDSRITTEFHRRAVRAANDSTDIKRDIEARRAAFVADLFGTTSRIQQAGRMGDLTVSTASGVVIETGVKTKTIDVPADVVLRIIEGTADLKALGFTKEEAATLAHAWADNEALPVKRQKRVFQIERRGKGKDVELTMSQDEAIQYLLWSNQKASREQMERDGWSDESFQQLRAFLSDDAKAMAGFFTDEYARMGRLIEPVYRRMFHAPFPQVTNYSPIFRDISRADSIIDLDQQGHGSGVSSGFILARNKNARAAMRRTSAISAFMQHVESAAHWVSHVELVRDLRSVLTDKEVQNAIRASGRTAAANGIKKRVMQLENQGKVGAAGIAELDSWGSRLLQARAFKGLAWRISPILKQASAYFNPLLADVPAWDYMRGTARLLSGKLDVSAMWKSADIQRRIEMGFSAEARIAMDRLGYTGSTLLAAMGKGMLPMQLTDAGWTTAGAAVAFDYYRRINIKSGMNETLAENAALDQLEMMIAESAQPTDAANRSLTEGLQNPWLKSMWMFAGEQRKTLAIEIMALRRLATGKSKNKAMDVQRAVVAHVVMATTTQLMAGILSLLMGDHDDREREWSVAEWAAAIAAGPINGLFVLGDAIDYVGRRLFGLHAFEPSTAIGQAVKVVASAPASLDKVINGDPKEQRKAFLRLGEAVGQVTSIVGPGNPFTAADVILGNPLKDAEKILSRMEE